MKTHNPSSFEAALLTSCFRSEKLQHTRKQQRPDKLRSSGQISPKPQSLAFAPRIKAGHELNPETGRMRSLANKASARMSEGDETT
ncbi:hypothetical protein KC19_4G127100 [Ceratodon purpureus]|uniref:Uncharacterized protein n=1 Tax=Ceratodon purpureus TaxID=3225 RepID=A0A8T0I8Q2_CERPU|nr:hypothetical protein KC19_4G127100 [Ceratodon purpureus]